MYLIRFTTLYTRCYRWWRCARFWQERWRRKTGGWEKWRRYWMTSPSTIRGAPRTVWTRVEGTLSPTSKSTFLVFPGCPLLNFWEVSSVLSGQTDLRRVLFDGMSLLKTTCPRNIAQCSVIILQRWMTSGKWLRVESPTHPRVNPGSISG